MKAMQELNRQCKPPEMKVVLHVLLMRQMQDLMQ
jgi:hypothetical protein